MAERPDPEAVAAALRLSVGLLRRRLRQVTAEGELTMPESAALARLDRGGPATSADLAKAEQISPQSMGATMATLEGRGLVARAPDPGDGRRILLSVTDDGLAKLRSRRTAVVEHMAVALADHFSAAELRTLAAAAPLLERLAETI